MSFLVLQSSCLGRGGWLLYFCGLLNVIFLLSFFASSSWCHGLVCGVWMWHLLVVLSYYLLLKDFAKHLQ